MYYKGKDACQGCGISGKDKPRRGKDSLCDSCQDMINTGRARYHDEQIDRAWVHQHHHAYREPELNILLHEFLSTISNPYTRGNGPQSIRAAMGSNAAFYSIPSVFVEPLEKLFSWMESQMSAIKEERNAMPLKIVESLDKERDLIYNQGVESGRKLLMQLNSGQISMEDFGKELSYKEVNNDN